MAVYNIRSMMLRGISLFVVIAFTVTTLIGNPSNVFAAVEALRPVGGIQSDTGLLKDLYAMPVELGSLVSSWEPAAGIASKTFVVQIQDAHANPEGQQNVAAILQYLEKK